MYRILLASPHMSDEGYEQKYIQEAFDTNWIAPLGKNVDEFEERIAELLGGIHSTALISGTAAIHLALKYLGIKPGDKVLCQSLTFSATVNPVVYEHAIPVFIDSEEGSWNMDPELLEQAIIEHKPKAVIVVHLYGIAAQIKRIKAICAQYNVPLIEDAAESLGTIVDGEWTGSFGDFGILSFNGNKIITTSGGGMLVSHDEAAIKKAHFWATQAREAERFYQHKEIGYNYRLSNICAGIGRGQLHVLDDRIEKKRKIFATYYRELSELEGVEFITERENERANYWLSTMLVYNERITPDMILDALEEENIEARPVWKPMHIQPVFENCERVGGKVAEKYFEHGVCLPSDTKMTVEEIQKVIRVIRSLW